MTPNVPPRVWGQATAAHTDESFDTRVNYCRSPEHLATLPTGRARPPPRTRRRTPRATVGGARMSERAAADLLNDDGTVDTGKVLSAQLTGQTHDHNPTAPKEACARWRRELVNEHSVDVLAANYGRTTITKHVRGECDHDHDTDTHSELRPLKYTRRGETSMQTEAPGTWRRADE